MCQAGADIADTVEDIAVDTVGIAAGIVAGALLEWSVVLAAPKMEVLAHLSLAILPQLAAFPHLRPLRLRILLGQV